MKSYKQLILGFVSGCLVAGSVGMVVAAEAGGHAY